jgi:membrane-associated phospholipid phosphatase
MTLLISWPPVKNLTAHWKLKLQLSIALTIFFCVPYFALQRFTLFAPARLPLSALDQAIPFAPAWVWVYQSGYLLLSLVPWAATSADDLKRYARGFVWLASTGFVFFLLVPVEGPRPNILPADIMFRMLVSYDAPLNSFPSLHVGLSVYTVLFAARAVGSSLSVSTRRGMIVLLSIWAAAIAFAALATKQHYAVDLPAGALLAWACHQGTWRSRLTAPRAFKQEVRRSGEYLNFS